MNAFHFADFSWLELAPYAASCLGIAQNSPQRICRARRLDVVELQVPQCMYNAMFFSPTCGPRLLRRVMAAFRMVQEQSVREIKSWISQAHRPYLLYTIDLRAKKRGNNIMYPVSHVDKCFDG